jgi:hypothetical protein
MEPMTQTMMPTSPPLASIVTLDEHRLRRIVVTETIAGRSLHEGVVEPRLVLRITSTLMDGTDMRTDDYEIEFMTDALEFAADISDCAEHCITTHVAG